jgi:hypothetical protein
VPAVEIPNPLSSLVSIPEARATEIFRRYLQGLDGWRVVELASLPPPQLGYVAMVLDTVDGLRPCYADGTNWLRFDNNAVVS